MKDASEIPVTVLAGYLGAGKTTRINTLLTGTHGKRIGVIVNDFGTVNIDEHLIEHTDESLIGLSNGCVCCTLSDGLGSAFDRLLEASPPMDCVVIETSGVARPSRVASYARTWPGFRLGQIVVVADATRITEQLQNKYIGATVTEQLASAHRIVLSHVDLMEAGATEIADRLSMRFGAVVSGLESHGDDPSGWLVDRTERVVLAPSGTEMPRFARETAAEPHSITIEADRPLAAARFRALLQAPPRDVLRIKGWVALDDSPGTAYLVHGVPGRWSARAAQSPLAPGQSRLVVIWSGDHLTASAVREQLMG